jgi:hypothetical protein
MHYIGKDDDGNCDHPGMTCEQFSRMVDSRHESDAESPEQAPIERSEIEQVVDHFRGKLGFAAPEVQDDLWEEFIRLLEGRFGGKAT